MAKATKVSKAKPRGKRPNNHPVKAFTARIEPELVRWVDREAKSEGLSRSQWISRLLRYAKAAQAGMKEAGLFDELESDLRKLVEKAIADAKRSPLK